jgi:hypothetical protein
MSSGDSQLTPLISRGRSRWALLLSEARVVIAWERRHVSEVSPCEERASMIALVDDPYNPLSPAPSSESQGVGIGPFPVRPCLLWD